MIPLIEKYFTEKGIISIESAKSCYKDFRERLSSGSLVTLGEVLVENRAISEKDLAKYYEETSGTKYIDIADIDIDMSVLGVLPAAIAAKYGIIPFKDSGDKIFTVMKDPQDLMAIQKIREVYRKPVQVFFSYPSEISSVISQKYGMNQADKAIMQMSDKQKDAQDSISDVFVIDENDEDTTHATVKYVNLIIKMAIEENASDIHIEPYENETVTRIRVDGLLREIQRAPVKLHQSVVARIKVMGNMDITEHKVPLDGRTSITHNGEKTDIRISSMPTVYGEKIVIRLLQKMTDNVVKESIGLSETDVKKYDLLINNHSGVILISGPTGSGKSTTMLTMLKILNTPDVNIITLEDPVEYKIPGICQVQINEKTGMTFAKGLKAALRQDPDIICIGEIRDSQTAEIAMRAAITGHLVISTIHTSSAIASIERLIDMGVEPYLIAPALLGVISQRLVRKLCPDCRKSYYPDPDELRYFGKEDIDGKTFYRPEGCIRCRKTGYRGRKGIFEIITVNKELRHAILNRAGQDELEKIAEKSGYSSLRKAGLSLIYNGETSVDEVKRVLNNIDQEQDE